jgi:hypothetical protein
LCSMTNENIEIIKDEIEKLIGPIGKFIVEKQIRVMGFTEEDFPRERLPELIDHVIDMGVYDKQMSKTIRTKIREKVGLEH